MIADDTLPIPDALFSDSAFWAEVAEMQELRATQKIAMARLNAKWRKFVEKYPLPEGLYWDIPKGKDTPVPHVERMSPEDGYD